MVFVQTTRLVLFGFSSGSCAPTVDCCARCRRRHGGHTEAETAPPDRIGLPQTKNPVVGTGFSFADGEPVTYPAISRSVCTASTPFCAHPGRCPHRGA